MRLFQRLFANHISKQKNISLKNIRPPPSFFRIPYDEQYEQRDFLRGKREKNIKKEKEKEE